MKYQETYLTCIITIINKAGITKGISVTTAQKSEKSITDEKCRLTYKRRDKDRRFMVSPDLN